MLHRDIDIPRTLFPDAGKCIHFKAGGRQANGWVFKDDQTTSVYEIAGHIGAASFCAPSVGGAGGMGMEWGEGQEIGSWGHSSARPGTAAKAAAVEHQGGSVLASSDGSSHSTGCGRIGYSVLPIGRLRQVARRAWLKDMQNDRDKSAEVAWC